MHGSWHSAVLLARVCTEAPHLDVGMISLLPLHHPVELAEQIATNLGVRELILRCQCPGMPGEAALQAIRRFGQDVLPHVQALS